MLNNQEYITTELEKVLYEIFSSYNYEVILLADRGFKSIDLFMFIDNLGCKYCISCTNDMLVKIEGKNI